MYFFLQLLIFYEDHIGNKCTFVCFTEFILGNIVDMLILLFAFASKLRLMTQHIPIGLHRSMQDRTFPLLLKVSFVGLISALFD